MASLSRGLLLPGFRSSAPTSRSLLLDLSRARAHLRSTPVRFQRVDTRALSKAPKPAPLKQTKYAFLKTIADKPTPTTLYEGPSHFWFYFGCWSCGLSIVAWTALTAPGAMQKIEGVPSWVTTSSSLSYVVLVGIGFFLVAKTPNIVHSIRFLPPAVVRATAQTSTAVPAAGPAAQSRMEVTVKRMIPWLKPKVIVTDLSNVSLQTRLSLPEAYVPHLQRIARLRAEEEKRKALWKFDMEHLLTMPFRRIGRGFNSLFMGFRTALTDMGMGHIYVDGKRYKIDVTQGFAHDGFRSLERLVHIRS